MADWPSLPPELIRRIAGCLLDTNDLDCYMDFRAVCPTWRSATDDPKNSSELRFRPHRWIIIHEVFESHSRLLVNIVSGRVVRKDLPLLRNYFVVATTHGGFFVLADKEPPRAAVVLNPFTGHMIRFKASPSDLDVCAAALSGLFKGKLPMSSVASDPRSSPTLILLSDRYYQQYYMAVPDSDRFTMDDEDMKLFALLRLAAGGGICAADCWQRTAALLPFALTDKIFSLMELFHVNYYEIFADKPVPGFLNLTGSREANQFFLVEIAGALLAIIKLQQHLKVFRPDNVTNSDELEPVKSIGNHAIFIGCRTCLSITTDNFQSIVANCIYYVRSSDSSLDIYQYDLQTDKEERVSEGIYSLNNNTAVSFANPPFTIVQLLSGYTINVRESKLAMEQLKLPRPAAAAAATPYLDYWSDSDLDIFW